MKTIIIDIETRSVVNLKTVGAWVYSEHTTTDVICLAWKVYGDITNHIWWPGNPVPKEFKDTKNIFVAHNALFEHAMFINVLIPRYRFPAYMAACSNWLCTRAMGVCVGMPGGLKDLAKGLGVAHLKEESGTYLINRYSNPIKKGIDEFRTLQGKDKQLMIDYNIGDILATEDIYTVLKDLPNVKLEQKIFQLDMKQNVTGLPIDVKSLNKINKVFDSSIKDAEHIMTKLGVNVRSVPQLKEYLKSVGFSVDNVQQKTIEQLCTQKTDSKTQQLLILRLFLGKASTKKYKTLKIRTSKDGKLRHFLMYFGAHTGRWAGRGFQPQNLPKSDTNTTAINKAIKDIDKIQTYDSLIEKGKTMLPGMIKASVKETFLLGDFAAIEARGLAYLAEEKHLLRIFANGGDPYIDMAATLFNTPVSKVTSKQRKLGKIIILACGYGMGINLFEEQCKEGGVSISRDLATKSVHTYRDKYRNIYNFWYKVEDCFKKAFTTKNKVQLGLLSFKGKKKHVRITLPNGRQLFYHGVQVTHDGISYINQSRKRKVHVWGGLLVENIVQAMCRDILVECMLKCDLLKINPILHVHDEIVCQVPSDRGLLKQAKESFEYVMNTAPKWLPNFPLDTEIEVSNRYHK